MNDQRQGSNALPWIIGCSIFGCVGLLVVVVAVPVLGFGGCVYMAQRIMDKALETYPEQLEQATMADQDRVVILERFEKARQLEPGMTQRVMLLAVLMNPLEDQTVTPEEAAELVAILDEYIESGGSADLSKYVGAEPHETAPEEPLEREPAEPAQPR